MSVRRRLFSMFMVLLSCVCFATAWVQESGSGDSIPLPKPQTGVPKSQLGTEGVWRTYRYVDGLVGNVVRTVIQDEEGMIWMGTDRGISRFDGANWKTYKGGGRVFMQDREGAIWTDAARFDGVNWISYSEEDGYPGDYVYSAIQDKDGSIWLGTSEHGVIRFDGKEWRTYSQEDGLAGNGVWAIMQDRDEAIWFGTNNGVSRFDGKSWKTYRQEDGLTSNNVGAIAQGEEGAIWFGTWDGGASRFDGENWSTYTQEDGLAGNTVRAIMRDNEGAIWFGTMENGVSRFDGKVWKTYTEKDGLAADHVLAIHQDREGAIWFGTFWGGVSQFDRESWQTYTQEDNPMGNVIRDITQDNEGSLWFATHGGVSQFDGETWNTYTQRDGLTHNITNVIMQDREGAMWVGTQYNGVSRFDGEVWKTYRQSDGLAHNGVWSILQDREGLIWFGTYGGVSRFDGKNWKTYTQEDGLAHNRVRAIMQDKEGAIWFGTWGGVNRFDGTIWETYTQEDGLAGNIIQTIIQDAEGSLWFGTRQSGVSRFDGKVWKTYTQEDGLADNGVYTMMQDNDGIFWFGTMDGGVCRFDGRCFQSIDSRDGFPNDSVPCVYMDRHGHRWLGTGNGVVRIIPSSNNVPPPIYITQFLADERSYPQPKGVLNLGAGVTRVVFQFHAISYKTHPGKMLYYYRLKAQDADWQGPIREEMVEYFRLRPGHYTFEVQAVDRDLSYSEPASVSIIISPPPFYRTGIFTFLMSIIGGASLLAAILLGIQRWRLAHNEKLRLQNELQDAREMQIALLPEAAPPVEGMQIAGRSIPANTVGGDFFDYLELADGKVGIAIADVSGKGLRAAMNAVLADGMMHEVATIEASCGRILSRLNAHLHPLMEKQMFTAFSLAILDQDAGVIQWSNAGQPLPMIKRSDGVSEADGEGELPLGMAPDVTYPDYGLKLQTGDIVIFYTDGIIEAENETEEMYGTERLEKALSGIDSAMSSREIIDAILKDVTDFAGSAEQYDDMTIVVIRKL